jgi:hypothetical protein
MIIGGNAREVPPPGGAVLDKDLQIKKSLPGLGNDPER